ncbi:MAG: DUF1289 domain-containing protein [Rheinheimera sp.]|mgnify:FL=1|uniref:DUF1289 domain-containing protein n=1 Tax=Arsukibacterium sp. UBA3155 TaxID=1946058 RepID=UPI000C8DF510|nr:DUF1289 domain-containing protein [Arsukibacterium sp. UBA3155]MAD75419.1 DUF1289 domain-containing protein [Rheinheimera sp.]|tara:strand:- start:70381 stop:70641 length:261 start_codon:yes stop_codon:yes gene_type:complete
MSVLPAPESPCVACCRLNSEKLCVGCYRHITEIVDWNRRSDAENYAILQKVAQRKCKAEQQPAADEETTAITQQEWQAAKAIVRAK